MRSRHFMLSASLLSLIVACYSIPSYSQEKASLYIIININNPVETLTTQEVRAIFLSMVNSYPDGKRAIPINLPSNSLANKAFMEKVLYKNKRSLRTYWTRLLFTGRGKLPTVLKQPADIIKAVSQTQQAIGYFVGGLEELNSYEESNNIMVVMTIPLESPIETPLIIKTS
ncbi:MAG: hypothetical protein KUG82_10590 [Pseudomonadales bacterium]|nr:hypothetical protein [Pseudomonadales bacterium]